MARKEGSKGATIVFRIAALVLSVAATVVMGTASQLVVLDAGGGRRWSSYVVSYSYYNALVYFVAAGAIAAVCSAAGLHLSAVNAKTSGAGALVCVLDALSQGFLFSAAGAAFAARSVVGDASGPWAGSGEGNSVCDAAGVFCGRVTAAAAVGAVAAVAVALAALASTDSHRSLRWCCDL